MLKKCWCFHSRLSLAAAQVGRCDSEVEERGEEENTKKKKIRNKRERETGREGTREKGK